NRKIKFQAVSFGFVFTLNFELLNYYSSNPPSIQSEDETESKTAGAGYKPASTKSNRKFMFCRGGFSILPV
ncbi:MAG: hypothetical protein ACLFP1_09685, partial [Candidatus Goldiibacteriota bacterium]